MPTVEELAKVIRMQEDGKYEHNYECSHWKCGNKDEHEHKDDCCGGDGSCWSCSCD
jgi:hypothetical protein